MKCPEWSPLFETSAVFWVQNSSRYCLVEFFSACGFGETILLYVSLETTLTLSTLRRLHVTHRSFTLHIQEDKTDHKDRILESMIVEKGFWKGIQQRISEALSHESNNTANNRRKSSTVPDVDLQVNGI